jgi:hypothetical protein
VKRRAPNAERWFSAAEEAALRRLVNEAFELRDGPYLRDAIDAIVVWYERGLPDRLERRAERVSS